MTDRTADWSERYIESAQLDPHGGYHQLVEWIVRETASDGVCDLARAWDRCERSDWMLWALERHPEFFQAHRAPLTRLAVDWVTRVQPPDGDQRLRDGLERLRRAVGEQDGDPSNGAGGSMDAEVKAARTAAEAAILEASVAWGTVNNLMMDPVRRTDSTGDEEAVLFSRVAVADAVEAAFWAVEDPVNVVEAARRSVLAASALAGAEAAGAESADAWDQARDRERRLQADDLRGALPNPWSES